MRIDKKRTETGCLFVKKYILSHLLCVKCFLEGDKRVKMKRGIGAIYVKEEKEKDGKPNRTSIGIYQ